MPAVEKKITHIFPEGGLRAWLVVLGSFCGMTAGFGFMNTIGVFQAYLSQNQLKQYSASSIGWIFSIYIFISFFGGLQIGPVFDIKGPRMLILAGSICLIVAALLMGICTQYWHFILTIGILAGAGTSLIFTPAVSAIGHFFYVRRGTATGVAAMGGAIGGIIFPLMLQDLLPRLGFAWSTRVMALIIGILCLASNLLVRGGMEPSKQQGLRQYLPRLQILADPAFALTTSGVCFMEWGLFIPITYITSFVITSHIGSASFAYKVLAVLNAGSAIGRFLPGVFADLVGRFNAIIVLLFLCMLTTLAFWLPAALLGRVSDMASDFTASPSMKPLVITYALLFGFASGANISLTPVCVGQLCKTENYGRYYATCYMLVSFATLTGIPIAGALMEVCGGQYYGVVIFTSACYAMSFVCFVAARVVSVGWRIKKDGNWVIF